MSQQKIYVGGAKENNGQYGTFHRVSFSKQDLEILMQNLNSKGYVNLNMNKRREVSQFGQTHSLVIDTWQPNQTQAGGGGGFQQQNNPQQAAPAYQAPNQQAPASQDFGNDRPPVPEMPQFDDINDPDDCPF